jgi:hypothetical protein
MGDFAVAAERSLGFEGWWRALFWAGTTTTSFLEGEDARAWRERGAAAVHEKTGRTFAQVAASRKGGGEPIAAE